MTIIGTASVMRHGATLYTGNAPDLVPEGFPKILATAQEIAQRFPQRPVFLASPTNRAVSTALRVEEAYGSRDPIRLEPLLAPIAIFDQRAMDACLKRAVGHLRNNPLEQHRVWDRFFMESPEFESEAFCETRSAAKARFMKFLAQLPTLVGVDRHIVATTHIEVVGTAVHEWFGTSGDYFGVAEVAHLTFFDDGGVEAEFRGEKKIIRGGARS